MYQIAGLAGVALATDQPERAARLLGAVSAAQQAIGISSILTDLNVRQLPQMARAKLGDEAFAHAWDAGQTMPWSEAVAEALTVLEPLPVSPIPNPQGSHEDPCTH